MKSCLLNLGPQHPSSHGVLRVMFEMDGEYIKKASPEIGFLHRGTEKLCEYREYSRILPYFDRFDYVSTLAGEQAYSLAVEKLMNINIPFYATALRVLFVELIRISNHLLALTTHAMDVGAITPFLWVFEEREEICNILEIISGARMHSALIRPGGVNSILSYPTYLKLHEFTNNLRPKIDEIYRLFYENPVWKNRLEGVGFISKKIVENYALTGVLARASGVPRDLRKITPYDNYQIWTFSIPASYQGDCLTRFCLRIEEMHESLNIIEQVLAKLIPWHLSTNSDKINPYADLFKFSTPQKDQASDSMEELVHDFKMHAEGYSIWKNGTYHSIESPKGEFGVTLISQNAKKNRPHRLKVKGPGFNHLQSYNNVVSGHLLTDALTILGSYDIVLGEIDR